MLYGNECLEERGESLRELSHTLTRPVDGRCTEMNVRKIEWRERERERGERTERAVPYPDLASGWMVYRDEC